MEEAMSDVLRLAVGHRHLVAILTVALWPPSSAQAASREVGPADAVEAAINALQPGDEFVLRGGMYDLGSSRFSFAIAGTAAAPIVIRAKDGEKPHLHRPAASQNIIDAGSRWLVALTGPNGIRRSAVARSRVRLPGRMGLEKAAQAR